MASRRALSAQGLHFDVDNDFFAQQSGWVSADDGFLVRDLDGNGLIESNAEMFGGPDRSGFGDLSALDSNADGKIDAGDAAFGELKVWRDLNQDGTTQANELFSLPGIGIQSINLASSDVNVVTPQGNTIDRTSSFTRTDGSTGQIVDLILATDERDTVYRGDKGVADWAANLPDAKGYGLLTDLKVAASNDFAVRDALAALSSSMTAGDIAHLRAQAADVFKAWAAAHVSTYELAPVLVRTTADGATLVDRGIYVEDATGGYWTLKSGGAVLDAQGNEIARPTLEQVLAQTADAGAAWRVEQVWAPDDRTTALQHRTADPYLVTLNNGHATVVDHGVYVEDAAGGYWTLASGNPVFDAAHNVIIRPTLADLQASVIPQGAQWRVEQFGVSDPEARPFDKMALHYTDGHIDDYSIRVTDAQGEFWVWASNVNRALVRQERDGVAGGFNLRNYALDFATLKDLDNTEDSFVRARLVSFDELKFASQSFGVEPKSNIFVAGVGANGMIDYDGFSIPSNTGFMGDLMSYYDILASGFAVRIAMQGSLAEYFAGISYDPVSDAFFATTSREVAPMFEAIFAHAPAGHDDAAVYLGNWKSVINAVLGEVSTATTQAPSRKTMSSSMRSRHLKMFRSIWKSSKSPRCSASTRIALSYTATATRWSMAPRAMTCSICLRAIRRSKAVAARTSMSSARISGKTSSRMSRIHSARAVRTMCGSRRPKSADVTAEKDGQDRIIRINGTNDVLTIKDQFDGVWLDLLFGTDYSNDTEMVGIVFAWWRCVGPCRYCLGNQPSAPDR